MKKIINAVVICAVALSACTTPFKKAKDGSEYKVISSGTGLKAVTGNYMELNVVAKYKDSTLFNTLEEGMPQYGAYDTASFPVPFKEAFASIHPGDSVVLRISSDSIMSRGQAAPFMKKGQFIYQMYKVVAIYTTKDQVDSAQKSHMGVAKEKAYKKQLEQVEKSLADNKAKIESDGKEIEAYLAKNNIKATKTKWGTYIAVQTEGTGNTITAKDVASVNYTGRTFDSSHVFDSNTDPAFKHVAPIQVPAGQFGGIIVGWNDALMQMKKGTKAVVYIPSTLGYGKEGRMPEIKADKILVFDMEVVDVTSEEAATAKRDEEEKQMRAAQEKMMDSLKKANPRVKAELEKKGN